MPIVTINRGSYSKGKAVAEKLASRLEYECISREVLLDASNEFSIPEIKLIRALHDAPSVLERFTNGKERYLSYIYASLLQQARKENIVYHGLAGQFFLRDISHVLKVRIIADMRCRVEEEVRREHISPENALDILKKDDEERRKWGLQVYGTDIWDTRLYDIVLHICKLTVDDAVDILYQMVHKPAFQSTPESLKKVEDLALSAKVKANLAVDAPHVSVEADGGDITLSHFEARTHSGWLDRIKQIAAETEGVKKVHVAVVPPQDHHGHINPFHNV